VSIDDNSVSHAALKIVNTSIVRAGNFSRPNIGKFTIHSQQENHQICREFVVAIIVIQKSQIRLSDTKLKHCFAFSIKLVKKTIKIVTE